MKNFLCRLFCRKQNKYRQRFFLLFKCIFHNKKANFLYNVNQNKIKKRILCETKNFLSKKLLTQLSFVQAWVLDKELSRRMAFCGAKTITQNSFFRRVRFTKLSLCENFLSRIRFYRSEKSKSKPSKRVV